MEDTGGRAFPHSYEVMPDRETHIHHGMTLRDYFAAKAMQGMLACPIQPQSGPDMYAQDAYVVADAMLAERSKE